MVTTAQRIFNSLCTPWFAVNHHYMPGSAKADISRCVAACEVGSRIEVQVVVEGSLSLIDILRGVTARQRAEQVFCLKKTWDTRRRSGLLLYINIADKAIEVVADRGVPIESLGMQDIIQRAVSSATGVGTAGRGTKKLPGLIATILSHLGDAARASEALRLEEGEVDENELED